jgi:hypothetical protein
MHMIHLCLACNSISCKSEVKNAPVRGSYTTAHEWNNIFDLSHTVQQHSMEQNHFSEADACFTSKDFTLITIKGQDTFLCLYNYL